MLAVLAGLRTGTADSALPRVREASSVGGDTLRAQNLTDGPGLPRDRVSSHGFRREAVKGRVISGMNRNQLPLQMRGKFRQLHAGCRERLQNFVAILAALRGALQIKQARVPRRNLYALVAEPGRPFGNIA